MTNSIETYPKTYRILLAERGNYKDAWWVEQDAPNYDIACNYARVNEAFKHKIDVTDIVVLSDRPDESMLTKPPIANVYLQGEVNSDN